MIFKSKKSGTDVDRTQVDSAVLCRLDGNNEYTGWKRYPMAFGPIDLVALEFKGNNFNDDVIASMAELVGHEIIRILDLVVLHKDKHGEVAVQELQELLPADLQLLEPLKAEISGMITVDDINTVGRRLKENTTAAIMLFENLWAIRLKQDISDGGGRLVMHERIPTEVVVEAINDLAEYD
jgi:hypothetical protein